MVAFILTAWLLLLTGPPILAVGVALANLTAEIADNLERRCRCKSNNENRAI